MYFRNIFLILYVACCTYCWSHCGTPKDINHRANYITAAKVIKKQVVCEPWGKDSIPSHLIQRLDSFPLYLFVPTEELKGHINDTLFLSFLPETIYKIRNFYYKNYLFTSVNYGGEDLQVDVGDSVILYFEAYKPHNSVPVLLLIGYEEHREIAYVKRKIAEFPFDIYGKKNPPNSKEKRQKFINAQKEKFQDPYLTEDEIKLMKELEKLQ